MSFDSNKTKTYTFIFAFLCIFVAKVLAAVIPQLVAISVLISIDFVQKEMCCQTFEEINCVEFPSFS